VNTVITIRFHKMLGSSRVAAQLVGSKEGLSSVKSVGWVDGQWVRIWHDPRFVGHIFSAVSLTVVGSVNFHSKHITELENYC
jgi:hypothetical protein